MIVLLANWLIPTKLGPEVEPLLVGGGAIVGCWLLTSGLIERVNRLQPLFGVKRRGGNSPENTNPAGAYFQGVS